MRSWSWLPFVLLLGTIGYPQAEQETDIRRLGPIHTIENTTNFELILTDRGTPGTIVAQGRKLGIESLITEVENGVLKISQLPTKNRLPKLPFFNAQLTVQESLKVVVACRDLKKYKTSGTGSTALIRQRFQHLELIVEQSGVVHLRECRMYSLESKLKGSGQIIFEDSETVDAKFHLEGDGQIQAHDLRSKNSQAEIFGEGIITTWPRDYLEGKVIGEGKLQYRGIPSNIKRQTEQGGVIEKYFPGSMANPSK